MRGPVPAGAIDEIQRMQDGVRDWVRQGARHAGDGLDAARPAILLSQLCASAFGPILMAGDVPAADIRMLSSVGGGALTQAVADALARLRQRGRARTASREELEKGIARQVQQALAAGDQRANALRSEIASVLKAIDAGGIGLRAAMEETNERVRTDVIAAISVLSFDFSEMRFLIKDAAKAAEELQRRLDAEGANVWAIIGRNERQSTAVRLVREKLAARAGVLGVGGPSAAGRGDRVGGCPYRGLLPFGETDAELFYGRERLAAELAGRLATRVTRGGLVVVTGASGSGKSSLLRAGLLPILGRGQQVPGSGHWPRIVMTPTKDPLTELATCLAALGGTDTVAVRDGLVQHPDQAHLAVWSAVLAAARHDGGHLASDDSVARLVLIVDQFEQLFTLNPGPEGEAARRAFVMALCAAATNQVGPRQEPPALVVIAVRGDFWGRCVADPELASALQDGQFVVGPMSESELRVAITGPADAAGLRIEPVLTDTILTDLRAAGSDGAAGALPLLSQAMALTWEKREEDLLTGHGYGQVGGVSHAVQTGADEIYDALPAAQQALAREVLCRMTVTSSDGRLTGRPLTRDEFYSALPGANQAQADAVLEAFVAGRLVVIDGGRAQISQDILLRAWPRLRGWLEEDQASSVLYRYVADAADAWHSSGSDSSFLYRTAQLTALQQAATRWSAEPARYPALTSGQLDFLQASERAATRSGRRWRSAIAILAAVTLAVTTALVFVFLQRNTALEQRDQAIYNQTVAEALKFGTSNTPLAARLNLAAYRLKPTQDQASRLLDAENTPLSSALTVGTGGVGSVAFSPGGHTLASGTNDGTVRLWNVADPVHPESLAKPLAVGSAVYSVAFSPDGRTLASGSYDGTIRLWNVADPRHPQVIPQTLIAGTGAVYSVAFSPDGRTLASGDIDGTVRLWDIADPAHPRPLGRPLTVGSAVYSVAFSPDGRTLASGEIDGTVRLWDIADPARPRPLGRPLTVGSAVFSVAFSPDGRTLASGTNGGAVQLWDAADPARPRPLGRPLTVGSAVFSVAFSPDGRTLASGSDSGAVQLWDAADPAHPRPLGQPLTAGTNAVLWVAFSSDGRTLASGSYDGTVRVWSLPQTVLTGGSGAVAAVAFSPDGRTLASGTNGGAVQLWDAADPAHPRPLGRPLTVGRAVFSVAFSPDGRTLASGSDSGAVQLWDTADPAHPRPLGQPLTAGAFAVDSVAFSPDGRTLASGSYDGTVQLWNLADPAHPEPLGLPMGTEASVVYTVAFSPDGRTLASGGDDGAVRLWDVADPAHPRPLGRPLAGGVGAVAAVAFSPDGRTLASGSYDGSVRLWDVVHPARARRLGRPLSTGANIVYSVAFSPDGHMLATGGDNGAVRLWDVADPAHLRPLGLPLSGGTGVVYSVAFGRDGHTLATGTYNGAVQLWNLNVGYAIQRICATAGDLTPRQWHAYIPQLPYKRSCAH
jgi:WD40 repeat protein